MEQFHWQCSFIFGTKPYIPSVYYLSHNLFEGLFLFSSFSNQVKLEFVRFISDNSKFEIETENPGWKPMFQLKVLVLSNCNLNKLDKGIPTFLFHQYNLLAVDLSQNNLAGRFPDWLRQNNTGLKFVKLQSNSFVGQFHLSPYSNMNLSWMDVSDNHFDGQLPKNIETIFPRLWLLHLSGNAFQGPLSSLIANMCDVEQIAHVFL